MGHPEQLSLSEPAEDKPLKHGHGHGDGRLHAHPMPLWGLITVWLTLMFLTWLTVTAAEYNLGPWELWVSMGIATVKALLVAAFFMHLIHDKAVNIFLLLSSFFFVLVFVFFVLVDYESYRPEIDANIDAKRVEMAK